MGLIDNIINECDIALKTLSNSKPGTNREYPVTKKSSKSEELTKQEKSLSCLLYTSPSPRDISGSRMPSSA